VRAPGDAELEALWHEWHRHVLAYALRRADPTTAEDAVAETFVIAWRRLADVPERPLP
jgi:RNA polymerase sigma-70 factor, ECF subfamily